MDARPIRGVMVNSINSVLYGKTVTEVRLKLRGSGILDVGTSIEGEGDKGLGQGYSGHIRVSLTSIQYLPISLLSIISRTRTTHML